MFLVKEFAFDAVRLKELLKDRLDRTDVRIRMNAEAVKVAIREDSPPRGKLQLQVEDRRTGETSWFASDHIYNCTYSNLNAIPARSGLAGSSCGTRPPRPRLFAFPDISKNSALP